ncbi:deoxyribodipyrimidine photolyase [Catenovulum agarivorans DS-2]|uniref:Deoxyribodipyrimidine photo-lyase n=1 Tax=Catenovulum agarivorans DS-2 TaxID=1328313 RepID=W7QT74_9ALTE|nr:deoxyribodipyrimidine photo-lyase [Catenovulum agarivorans]EWH12237.1 deoxyribodipyrimidine photolyase [Catenovulum agarivorans DS-2]
MQLVWYRNDLRTYDHSALHHACELAQALNQGVACVFVFTKKQWQQQHMAEIKRALIKARVMQLQQELAGLHIPLVIHHCDTYQQSAQWVAEFCQTHEVSHCHITEEYELNEQKRDQVLEQALQATGTKLQRYHDSLILKPASVVKENGEPYKVFTPFKKQWLNQLQANLPYSYAKPTAQTDNLLIFDRLYHKYTASNQTLEKLKCWPHQEEDVINQLRGFSREHVIDYAQKRDYPIANCTSRLSPYFAIGVLSPRQALNRIILEHQQQVFEKGSGPEIWLSELIWREFYKHLSWFYPDISKGKAVKAQYQNIQWHNDQDKFAAWCEGQTGYPIVDAAMRQLNELGWMHNRLRMIVASFLIKDLHINWRWGEDYFMQKLVDGDYAANNGGWQWCASTGHDAAPYFRIFNPTTQGERFDPKGAFVKMYCPELQNVPEKWIHKPHEYAKKYRITIDYPKPIVDHKQARELTLQMYSQAT